MLSFLLSILLSLGIGRADAASPPVAATVFSAGHALPLAGVRIVPANAPVKKDASVLGIPAAVKGAVVLDWKSGAVLMERNADEPLPIASISKLLTAIVASERVSDWDAEVTYAAEDDRPGSIPYLAPGERVRLRDLLNMSLVASSNGATAALARAVGILPETFAAEMNVTAAKIGMRDSRFVEPTGLDPRNVASAKDAAVLVRKALGYAEIREAVERPAYEFTALSGRDHHVRSTDELLGTVAGGGLKLLGGKTGFLEEAGYCFGAAGEDSQGHRVVAVVLGAPTKEDRFRQVRSLMNWTFGAYRWPEPSPAL